MGVEYIKRLDQNVNVITAPLHTRDGWEWHFDSQGAGELRFANTKNKEGRQALSDLKFGVPGNYFLGREFARLIDWSQVDADLWLSDECHSLSSPRSLGFKSHQRMKVQYRLLQSATWFGSSFENAWTIARLLWPELDGYGQVADRSRYRWLDYWCQTVYDHFAPMNKKVLGEKVPGRFAAEAPCYVRIESDLPEIEPIVIHYDLSPTQRKLYRQMEEEALVWLRNEPLVAELDITRRIRLREITLAEPHLDALGQVQFDPDAKSSLFDTMTEMLGDMMGEQVLMGTHSAKFARYVAERSGPAFFAWTGDKSEEQRASAKEDFLSGNIQHLVSTYGAMAEGVDLLQSVSHVMFELSQPDSPVLAQQFRGRLNRKGQKNSVLNYRFVARDTLEDNQHESLLTKELSMRKSI